MANKRPYFLTFRIRPDRKSDYSQIYLRLRVRGSEQLCIGAGVFVTAGQWQPYTRQKGARFRRVESVEQKLDTVRDKIAAIYSEQRGRSVIEGFAVTTRSILWQFRGLSPKDGREIIKVRAFASLQRPGVRV